MRATAQALFMVGVLVGSKVFGILSDVYGRKFSFFLSVVLQERRELPREMIVLVLKFTKKCMHTIEHFYYASALSRSRLS
jgi:MFS family permease